MSIFSRKNTDAKPVKEEKKPIENKEDLTLAQLEEKEDKKTKPGKKKTADKVGKGSALAYKWIRRPIITEKATYLAAENKYIFEVALNANKIEVAKAISKLYNVDVEKVNVIVNRGKRVTYGRIHGRTKRTKKAIVTLKQGQTISVYEGV